MWGRVKEGGSVWLTFTGSNRLTQRWQSGPSIGCWWQELCAKQRTDAHSPRRTREEGTYGFLSIPHISWTIRQLYVENYLSAIARVQDLILNWFTHSLSKRVLERFCFSVIRIGASVGSAMSCCDARTTKLWPPWDSIISNGYRACAYGDMVSGWHGSFLVRLGSCTAHMFSWTKAMGNS